MESMECHCCLVRAAVKDLKTPYSHLGITEIYSYMIKECFEIQLITGNDGTGGICETCVGRLRDASDFKLQVQHTQAELRGRIHRTEVDKDEVKLETIELSPTDETKKEWTHIIDFKTENEIKIDDQELLLDSSFIDLGFQTTLDADPNFKGHSYLAKDEVHWELETSCHNDNSLQNSTIHRKSKRKLSPKRSKTFVKKKATKEIKYQCEICNKLFTSRSYLRNHKKMHTAKNSYVHGVSDEKKSTKKYLRIGEKLQKENDSFYCEICGKQYCSKFSLIIHQRVHSGEKPFTCDTCKKAFAKKQNLGSHIRTHMGLQPYSCKVCSRKFSDPSSLRRHNLIHTGDKAYPCDLCSKKFRYKFRLDNHRLIHTGEKPHGCEICGKCFSCKSNLKEHLEIHVKGKTYACEHCSKTYSTKNSLRQHKRLHATKVPRRDLESQTPPKTDSYFKTHPDGAEDKSHWEVETGCKNHDNNSFQICTINSKNDKKLSPKCNKASVKKKAAKGIKIPM